MRPFKFFFAFSIGIMLFFFFAKVVFIALISAAFMSIIYAVFQKAKRFFRKLSWEDSEAYDLPRNHQLPYWKEDIFSNDTTPREKVYLAHHRRIIIE